MPPWRPAALRTPFGKFSRTMHLSKTNFTLFLIMKRSLSTKGGKLILTPNSMLDETPESCMEVERP